MFTSSISPESLQSLIGGKDPICGKDLKSNTAAASIVREGKTIYFCSGECKTKFEAKPAK